MFANLVKEKLGNSSVHSSPPPPSNADATSSTTSTTCRNTDNDSVKANVMPAAEVDSGNESKSAASKDVVLQSKFNDLLGKMKVLKREKEQAETLVNSIRQQQREREEELVQEHRKKHGEMQESFHLSMKQKEAEKSDLQRRLEESEKYREKILKRDEDSDELKDFQNQELGKVKHMLIIAQNQVVRFETESKATHDSLARESARVKELERQFRDAEETAQLKTAQLRSLEEKNAEDTSTFTSTLKDLRAEKVNCQNQNEKLSELLNQKIASYSSLEEKLSILEEDYVKDKRAAEIFKREAEATKISLTDEKTQLVETIQGLEARISSADLGDDDKFKALEKDRQTLERRLVESREQLTEIKTSWSSKISALENQISHLNLKQVDDNVELSAKEDELLEIKARYNAQIEDYQARLKDADSRHAEVSSTLDETKLKLERRLNQHETENSSLQERLASTSEERDALTRTAKRLEESLAALESGSLEAELSAEEQTKEWRGVKESLEVEAAEYRRDKEGLEAKLRESKEKYEKDVIVIREDLYKQQAETEKTLKALRSQLREKEQEADKAVAELSETKERAAEWRRDSEEASKSASAKVEMALAEAVAAKDAVELRLKEAEERIEEKDNVVDASSPSKVVVVEDADELARLRLHHKKTSADLSAERKEKDELLLRNAELSQQVSALRSELAAAVVAAAALNADADDVVAPVGSDETLEKESEGDEKMERERRQQSGVDVESVTEMRKTIDDLQTQLTERNKTVKLQQQRIGDLRKTIQREFKMQTGGTANGLSSQGLGINYGSSTEDLPSICVENASSSTPSSNATMTAASMTSRTPPHFDLSTTATYPASVVPCSIINGSTAAVLPNSITNASTSFIPSSYSSPFLPHAGSSDVDDVIFPAAAAAGGEPSVVSFRYLKHVIIRFMISNEYEAQHLVKAVSTLLRFDKEEEKLVTDHLNYKVSWFGSKPSLKKLKSAKVKDVY